MKDDGYWFTTDTGIHVHAELGEHPMNAFIRQQGKKKTIMKKQKLSKKEYGRLAHLIDSNPKKWHKGKINSQVIDDNIYFFVYNSYNNFKIIEKNKLGD